MEFSMLMGAMLAAAIYVLTPGPAFLAMLGLGAAQGRAASAGFLFGHLAGDLMWAGLALVAIIGSRVMDPVVFHALAMICGVYLFWLGFRALTARRKPQGELDIAIRHPWRRGLIFGITNPKGYPVAVAMFTALLAKNADMLDWSSMAGLLAASLVGFVLADLILIWLVGLGFLRRFYVRHQIWIVRATGLIFIGFAIQAIVNALPGLWTWRKS
ncbi:LysE family translocator [Thalassospira sp. TSL5-1]|uniref:LysE family translocator n=1 Tax=Thalassospira sp. TSL5-1 TaxID=1544451 RepID=UPI00093D2375|nr:LysE family translocator [Thalassospira sp. TSL5-1]OKH89517.1 lysine transporter LysE [Thalassospira sp. TSL5-1]